VSAVRDSEGLCSKAVGRRDSGYPPIGRDCSESSHLLNTNSSDKHKEKKWPEWQTRTHTHTHTHAHTHTHNDT